MKPTERGKITRLLRAALPGIQEKGRLLFVVPIKRILRGLYLEDSSSPDAAYVWTFVQPLYAPSETVSFNMGERLGGNSATWGVNGVDALVALARVEVPRFHEGTSSPEDLLNSGFFEGRSGEYAREARAYSLVAARRFVDGIVALRDLAGSLGAGPAWVSDLKQRALLLAERAEQEPEQALALLANWELQTRVALRLPADPC